MRRALEAQGIEDGRELINQLKYFDFDDCEEHERPSFRWHRHAKSFYSEEAYADLKRQQDDEAEQAEQRLNQEADAETEIAVRRKNRSEEGRLGTYVHAALENIYQSDQGPEDVEYAFDVHSERAGSEFENVDVLAVHWRSDTLVDVVSVEVKLDFTAKLVQQARNYMRFSDRVWIAVPVLADTADAGTALRDYDPLLFDHVVDSGLGILACRRRPGRSYEIVPVHWPQRVVPDPVEKEAFLERYRHHFEAARVLAPQAQHSYPKVI